MKKLNKTGWNLGKSQMWKTNNIFFVDQIVDFNSVPFDVEINLYLSSSFCVRYLHPSASHLQGQNTYITHNTQSNR